MSQSNRFCEQCGAALTPGVRFCESCGRPVAAPAGAPGRPSAKRAPAGSGVSVPLLAGIAVIVVLVIAITVVIGILLARRDRPPSQVQLVTATPWSGSAARVTEPTPAEVVPPTTDLPQGPPVTPPPLLEGGSGTVSGERQPFEDDAWGIGFEHPAGWTVDNQSTDDMFALLCGPSSDALDAFETGVETAGRDAPVLAVMRSTVADVPHLEGIEDIGPPSAASVLAGFILYLEDEYAGSGLDLEPVGDLEPVTAARSEGARSEHVVTQDGRSVYLATFLSGDLATLLMMTGPEAQQAEMLQAFGDVLESLQLKPPAR